MIMADGPPGGAGGPPPPPQPISPDPRQRRAASWTLALCFRRRSSRSRRLVVSRRAEISRSPTRPPGSRSVPLPRPGGLRPRSLSAYETALRHNPYSVPRTQRNRGAYHRTLDNFEKAVGILPAPCSHSRLHRLPASPSTTSPTPRSPSSGTASASSTIDTAVSNTQKRHSLASSAWTPTTKGKRDLLPPRHHLQASEQVPRQPRMLPLHSRQSAASAHRDRHLVPDRTRLRAAEGVQRRQGRLRARPRRESQPRKELVPPRAAPTWPSRTTTRAYEAYQQAVYRDGKNPTFWCSIGVLYYQINQLPATPSTPTRVPSASTPTSRMVWFDLGSLYEACNNQISDAIHAYERAADLDPDNPQIQQRLQLLRNAEAKGGELPEAPRSSGRPIPPPTPTTAAWLPVPLLKSVAALALRIHHRSVDLSWPETQAVVAMLVSANCPVQDICRSRTPPPPFRGPDDRGSRGGPPPGALAPMAAGGPGGVESLGRGGYPHSRGPFAWPTPDVRQEDGLASSSLAAAAAAPFGHARRRSRSRRLPRPARRGTRWSRWSWRSSSPAGPLWPTHGWADERTRTRARVGTRARARA
ncbi:hypothetical protein L1887_55810 [Cichorium endivia]|nr:hypothetical protein L1887_55810 [Cichorium endivia]